MVDFDGDDLVNALFGTVDVPPPPPTAPAQPVAQPSYLGPVLLMLAGLAVTIAIGLALQFDTNRAQPEPRVCDGLYASVSNECCDDDCCDQDWVENWAPCRLVECPPDAPDSDGGLFDAEAHFADC